MDMEHEEEKDIEEETTEDVSFEPEDGEGNVATIREKYKKQKEELALARKERTEYLTGWQRAKADYVNLKKESDERFAEGVAFGKSSALESILPALDSFSMAMADKKTWESVDVRWRTGIEYIYTQFNTALSSVGIETLGSVGEVFDPSIHESIETVPTENKEDSGTIHRVTQKGYKIGTRIIRPARVVVYSETKEDK